VKCSGGQEVTRENCHPERNRQLADSSLRSFTDELWHGAATRHGGGQAKDKGQLTKDN